MLGVFDGQFIDPVCGDLALPTIIDQPVTHHFVQAASVIFDAT